MVLTIFTYCPPSGNYNLHNLPVEHQDTGWINDENPQHMAAANAERHNFQTPLDEIDAAARVVDPVLAAANGAAPVHGQFLKDYAQTEW